MSGGGCERGARLHLSPIARLLLRPPLPPNATPTHKEGLCLVTLGPEGRARPPLHPHLYLSLPLQLTFAEPGRRVAAPAALGLLDVEGDAPAAAAQGVRLVVALTWRGGWEEESTGERVRGARESEGEEEAIASGGKGEQRPRARRARLFELSTPAGREAIAVGLGPDQEWGRERVSRRAGREGMEREAAAGGPPPAAAAAACSLSTAARRARKHPHACPRRVCGRSHDHSRLRVCAGRGWVSCPPGPSGERGRPARAFRSAAPHGALSSGGPPPGAPCFTRLAHAHLPKEPVPFPFLPILTKKRCRCGGEGGGGEETPKKQSEETRERGEREERERRERRERVPHSPRPLRKVRVSPFAVSPPLHAPLLDPSPSWAGVRLTTRSCLWAGLRSPVCRMRARAPARACSPLPFSLPTQRRRAGAWCPLSRGVVPPVSPTLSHHTHAHNTRSRTHTQAAPPTPRERRERERNTPKHTTTK